MFYCVWPALITVALPLDATANVRPLSSALGLKGGKVGLFVPCLPWDATSILMICVVQVDYIACHIYRENLFLEVSLSQNETTKTNQCFCLFVEIVCLLSQEKTRQIRRNVKFMLPEKFTSEATTLCGMSKPWQQQISGEGCCELCRKKGSSPWAGGSKRWNRRRKTIVGNLRVLTIKQLRDVS